MIECIQMKIANGNGNEPWSATATHNDEIEEEEEVGEKLNLNIVSWKN